MINKSNVIYDSRIMTVPDMAEKYGCTTRNIQKILSEAGILSRIRKQSVKKDNIVKEAVIYKISYKDYVYIGQTMSFRNRINTHKSDLKRGKHSCIFLQWAYNQDPLGVENAVSNAKIIKRISETTLQKVLEEERNTIVKSALNGEKVVNELLGELIVAQNMKNKEED